MTVRWGKVIIDTNLLMHALVYKNDNIFDWIDEIYETIYIHTEVVNEFRIASEKEAILDIINYRGWILFNQNDEKSLAEKYKKLYWQYVYDIHLGFESLKTRKAAKGLIPKTSSNIGEIHCIALAQLISGNIICSNDYEIREVIKGENIRITLGNLDTDMLIEQDTIEDFCVYCVQANIARPSSVVKFFKVCHHADPKQKLGAKLSRLRNRLTDLLTD